MFDDAYRVRLFFVIFCGIILQIYLYFTGRENGAVQTLKDEVRNRILNAAEKLFYEKDYRSAKLVDIAKEAGIPVALIYTYFENKEGLFDAVVAPVYERFDLNRTPKEFSDGWQEGAAARLRDKEGTRYVHHLLKDHRRLIILMDKSAETKHEHAKDTLIAQMQNYIEAYLQRQGKPCYDPMLAHVLARSLTESVLELARHYQDEEWAQNMLNLLVQCHYYGVESL